MKNKITVLLLGLLAGCKPDPEPVQQLVSAEEVNCRYEIHLSHTKKLLDYQLYRHDTLQETTSYTYTADSIISRTERNGQLRSRHVYRLNNGALVSDTSYYTFYPYMDVYDWWKRSGTWTYQYDNGNLTGKISNSPDTAQYSWYTYRFTDGNLLYFERWVHFNGYDSRCADVYDYSNLPAYIDINQFEFNIVGCTSRNLPSHVSYQSWCPTMPSYRPPASEYTYTLDRQNLVIRRVEIYTPAGQTHDRIVPHYKEVSIYHYHID